MHTVTLTPWERSFLQGKVAAEYLVYAGHKANGVKFDKHEDAKLEALKKLSAKFEPRRKHKKAIPNDAMIDY